MSAGGRALRRRVDSRYRRRSARTARAPFRRGPSRAFGVSGRLPRVCAAPARRPPGRVPLDAGSATTTRRNRPRAAPRKTASLRSRPRSAGLVGSALPGGEPNRAPLSESSGGREVSSIGSCTGAPRGSRFVRRLRASSGRRIASERVDAVRPTTMHTPTRLFSCPAASMIWITLADPFAPSCLARNSRV